MRPKIKFIHLYKLITDKMYEKIIIQKGINLKTIHVFWLPPALITMSGQMLSICKPAKKK